jgi:nucleotide-binding universal stress UspA family protein
MNPTPEPAAFRRILFCTDFSENADIAFAFAVAEVRRAPDASLHLLHVVPEPDAQFWKTYIQDVGDADRKAREDMDAKIRESYQSRLPPGLSMTVTLRSGAADQEILAYADEIRADLLVIGREGRSSLGKVLFGNVTEKVVRKARCAVLVVPRTFADDAVHG